MGELPAETAASDSKKILALLEKHPITQRQERILRLIASRYYRNGYCFAAHETLARAIKCAKSTLQSDMDELEARGFLSVTRRSRTSNVTTLVSGLIDALRIHRLERTRNRYTKRFGIDSVLDFASSVHEHAVDVYESIAERTKDAFCQKTHKPSDVPLQNRPKAVSQPIPQLNTSSNLIISIASSTKNTDCDALTIVNKLRENGITERRAHELYQVFGAERVLKNIALGLHQAAKNPGGYLATAISENFASVRPLQGSEAAAVRARELKPKPAPKLVTPGNKITSPPLSPPLLESPMVEFARMSQAERLQFESQATSTILSSPPTWLRGMVARYGSEHDAVRGAIKALAKNLWMTARNAIREQQEQYA